MPDLILLALTLISLVTAAYVLGQQAGRGETRPKPEPKGLRCKAARVHETDWWVDVTADASDPNGAVRPRLMASGLPEGTTAPGAHGSPGGGGVTWRVPKPPAGAQGLLLTFAAVADGYLPDCDHVYIPPQVASTNSIAAAPCSG